MDTRPPQQARQGAAATTEAQAAAVQRGLQTIKTAMPGVYAAIQAKAAEIGQGAYGLVRRGLRGEPLCFWAMERGHVVGTPFDGHPVQAAVAQQLVQFGCAHVCMWGELPAGEGKGAGDGAD